MNEPWKPPGTMAKITGFLVSWNDWRKAGYPRRDAPWVVEIFHTHCEPCKWYDPNGRTPLGSVGTCTRCGCHVSDDAEDARNAIVWPTKGCPLDKPKWRASIEVDNQHK